MITKVIILLLCIFLHLVTGAEITSVQLDHHNLDTREGQQLLIPCFFKVDDPSRGYKIKLEWSVKPNGADTFRPIIRLDDTGYLPVREPNERASINLMQVSKGHCSLVINPVDLNDSGTYQVRIATNGMEKPGTENVNIRVLKSHGTHDLHSNDTNADRPGTTEVFEDHGLMFTKEFLQIIKNRGYLLYLLICGGVVLFLFLLSFVTAIVLVCVHWNLGRKITNASKLKEEGRMPKKSTDNPDIGLPIKLPEKQDVVIDMDGCNQPMNPTDAPSATTETIPTAEMTIQGSMLMKLPEKQDVVIDMDACNQPMNPTDAPAPTTETIPTAEMTIQGSMLMKLPEKQDVVIDMDACNQLMQPIGAPDLSPETAPTAEMTKEGSMPVKPPEKADVVRDMDECKPMQPTDVTVLPLETEPQAKRRKTWKRFFRKFKYFVYYKKKSNQWKEEEEKTRDTNLTDEIPPQESTSWIEKSQYRY